MAVKIGVMALCENMHDIHVRFMVDNQTAVTYLNNMAKDIWQYADARNIWVSAAHIPSSGNPAADTDSRKFNEDTEWMISDFALDGITRQYGMPDIDMFASRINHRLLIYMVSQKGVPCVNRNNSKNTYST